MKRQKIFVGDFETVVFDEQEYTEVWAAAVVELNTEDVKILHSINETYDYLISLNCNLIIYFHNLKFDGAFWIDFLINKGVFECDPTSGMLFLKTRLLKMVETLKEKLFLLFLLKMARAISSMITDGSLLRRNSE